MYRYEALRLAGEQVGCQLQVPRDPASALQRRPPLGEVAVRVPHRVGAVVRRHFAEQQLAAGIAAGAGDARGRVDHHFAGRVDEATPRQRDQRDERRGRVAPRIGDELGPSHLRSRELGQPVHRFGRQPEVGGEVDGTLAGRAGLVHVASRDAVRQRREHDLGALERGSLGLEELVALQPLACRRVRRGERHGSPRMPRQEPQQLLADIPRGPEHAHGHFCIIIHRTGKICSPGGNARAAPATCRSYSTRSRRGLGRYARPTLPHGFPSTRTTSAVKSKRPWNRLDPTPYMSTGTRCSSNWRIFSTLKPPGTTIFTWVKPSRSTAPRASTVPPREAAIRAWGTVPTPSEPHQEAWASVETPMAPAMCAA